MGCKFLDQYEDRVPAPFGPGTVAMPTAECRCDEATDEDIDNCGPKCRHYQEETAGLAQEREPEDPDDPRLAFLDEDPINTFERQQEVADHFGQTDPCPACRHFGSCSATPPSKTGRPCTEYLFENPFDGSDPHGKG